eukprot:TRINITY_DN68340_c0_g1_i1.p1 TRINITY_DN68340_c0_g1~~TRINITY_DN68340_c0_g1_i1.p1  ORF type:complete len:106 (-),score=24.09 TRINITY_DN68340_c0_g1_i1:34-324(-)
MFVTNYKLKEHIDGKHEKKIWPCEQCGKTFHYRHILNLHVRIHNQELNCVCEICMRQLSLPIALWRHYKLVHKLTKEEIQDKKDKYKKKLSAFEKV